MQIKEILNIKLFLLTNVKAHLTLLSTKNNSI